MALGKEAGKPKAGLAVQSERGKFGSTSKNKQTFKPPVTLFIYLFLRKDRGLQANKFMKYGKGVKDASVIGT